MPLPGSPPPAVSSAEHAAAMAIAPMTFGDPASSRSGSVVQTTLSRATKSTAPPPARRGSVCASSAAGAINAPAPKGAYILWPLIARQSMPSAVISMARCGASWAASTVSSAPWRCANSAISRSGNTSPVTLLAPVTATIATSWARNAASRSASSAAGDDGGGTCTTGAIRRQGSRLA